MVLLEKIHLIIRQQSVNIDQMDTKKFGCEFCHKSYKYKRGLNQHKKDTHSVEKIEKVHDFTSQISENDTNQEMEIYNDMSNNESDNEQNETDSVISNDDEDESENVEHEQNETDTEINIEEDESENAEHKKLWKNLFCVKKNKQFKPSKNVKQKDMVKTVYKLLKNKKNAVINNIPKTINSNFWSNLQDFFKVEEESSKDIYWRFSILLNFSHQKYFFSSLIHKFEKLNFDKKNF